MKIILNKLDKVKNYFVQKRDKMCTNYLSYDYDFFITVTI